jgi:bifunctional non-homologous end joining protein LigD
MRSSVPKWLEPMAATLTADRFVDQAWTYERKFDGIRMLAFVRGDDVQLWSRNRLSLTAAYPSVAAALAALSVRSAVFDGEATGAWGRQGAADYHVFDLLWLNGRSVTTHTLEERRALLGELSFRAPVARVVPLDPRNDPPPWERACLEGWEGVIAKRLDSPYEHRRSKAWLKMKCEASQELVVGGFTDPQGGRIGLGALLLGYFEGVDFVYAGKVGTGFDTELLHLSPAALACRGFECTGRGRRWSCRSPSASGRSTTNFGTRDCWVCARTNVRATSYESARDYASGKAPVSRLRHHQA